ncbi:MAG TPA: lanthionine synthetase LanC family protein, partial [Nitrososphaera sp.]|nr:lanthionine synthetase LanC family protein [Nitrososphaera sp.]
LAWTTSIKSSQPLTGFSHGAAGMSLALLELAKVSGEPRFLDDALRAMEYERGEFDPILGNWPDFRDIGDTGGVKHMVTWCHGAPGIGLARLRSLAHVNDQRIRDEIIAAIRITVEKGFGHSHCLCHGDLGNMELLLEASNVVPDPRLRADLNRFVSRVFASIKQFGWVCGIPDGLETPGLMTGLAGIGYGLLRLAEPGIVPSVLTLSPPMSRFK